MGTDSTKSQIKVASAMGAVLAARKGRVLTVIRGPFVTRIKRSLRRSKSAAMDSPVAGSSV